MNESVEQTKLATRSQRLCAILIDGCPLILFSYAVKHLGGFSGLLLLPLIAYVVYQAVLLSNAGQTVGKKIMHIAIRDVKTGKNGGFNSNVALRGIVNSLISIIPFYVIVDILFIFRDDRRCVHDFIAGTHVVQQEFPIPAQASDGPSVQFLRQPKFQILISVLLAFVLLIILSNTFPSLHQHLSNAYAIFLSLGSPTGAAQVFQK